MEWLTLVHGTAQPTLPTNIHPGDDVRVWFKILEQGKERLGQFEGLVIRVHGHHTSKTFTVRRVTHGEGVERVFPLDAKTVARIEVLRQGRVKRSRLYFLRTVVGKTRIASADAPAPTTSAAAATPPATDSAAEPSGRPTPANTRATSAERPVEPKHLPERSDDTTVDTVNRPASRTVPSAS